MKKALCAVTGILLIVSGCRHPEQIVVPPGPADVSITFLPASDTTKIADSTNVLTADPEDNVVFAANLTVQRTVNDTRDTTGIRQIKTIDFASAAFLDWSRPAENDSSEHHVGYFGDTLSFVSLNGDLLPPRANSVSLPTVGDVQWGVKYYSDLSRLPHANYRPGKSFTWKISVHGTDSTSYPITAPDDFILKYPRGGDTLSRSVPAPLSWQGSGNLVILISEYSLRYRTAKPILFIKPSTNAGQLLLSTSVLNLLPSDHRSFVFTFILYNRKEVAGVTGYNAKLLVEAAVVYNSYVTIH